MGVTISHRKIWVIILGTFREDKNSHRNNKDQLNFTMQRYVSALAVILGVVVMGTSVTATAWYPHSEKIGYYDNKEQDLSLSQGLITKHETECTPTNRFHWAYLSVVDGCRVKLKHIYDNGKSVESEWKAGWRQWLGYWWQMDVHQYKVDCGCETNSLCKKCGQCTSSCSINESFSRYGKYCAGCSEDKCTACCPGQY